MCKVKLKCLLVLGLFVTSGCTVNVQNVEKVNSENTHIVESSQPLNESTSKNDNKKVEYIDSSDATLIAGIIKDYIIKNKAFDVTLDNGKVSRFPDFKENDVAPTFEIEVSDGHIKIFAKSGFPEEVKKMKILDIYEENDEIKYDIEYALYETFVYYKDNTTRKNDGYLAYLKYYKNSSGETYLKLNCYHQYRFYIEYDDVNDVFIDVEEGSETYGNPMKFKESLEVNIRPAYQNVLDKEKLFLEKLEDLIEFIKIQFI